MSIFFEEALKLAELGYLVFQCEPNGKAPFFVSVHGGELGLTRGIDFVKIRHGCERPNHCQTSSKSCRA